MDADNHKLSSGDSNHNLPEKSSSTRKASFSNADNEDTASMSGTQLDSHASISLPGPSEPRRESLKRTSVENYDDGEVFEPEPCVPEYSTITQDLHYKLENFPQKTAVPFYNSRHLQRGHGTGDVLNGGNENHWKFGDSAFVRLPQNSLSKTINEEGGRNWDKIVKQLKKLKRVCESDDIQDDFANVISSVVTKYSPESWQKTNFCVLAHPDLAEGLRSTLPIIIDFALKLSTLLAEPIPLLKSGEGRTIYLTRKLCASLLANCFLCTLPPAHAPIKQGDFNFHRLYNDTHTIHCDTKKEKLKCIFNYFQIISKMEEPFLNEIVSFERRCVTKKVDWGSLKGNLCIVKVEVEKKIEDADGMLQIDFANKSIGGGVLNDACVMEEIRFSISPELLVSRIFTEVMNDNEAIVITGSQLYSRYTGYATSFKYAGPFDFEQDGRFLDNLGRTFSQIAAIDAINFSLCDVTKQYQKKLIGRELHKCYVAYIPEQKVSTPVATGNWGCGSFKGDPELKFLLQWIVASYQNRPALLYHTVGDTQQSQRIQEIFDLLQIRNTQVGKLYHTIAKFQQKRNDNQFGGSLFNYLHHKLGSGDEGSSEGESKRWWSSWRGQK